MRGVLSVADYPLLEHLADECAQDAEFRARFGSEEACVEWFKNARWPAGFRCAKCGSGGCWLPRRKAMLCSSSRCRKVTSITADTFFHGTKKPLRTWFEAAYLIVQRGVNARTLQRLLRLTYKVAWAWAHKLRRALRARLRPEGAPVENVIRLDAGRKWGDSVEDPHPAGACGCSRLLRRDWFWPDELAEEKALPADAPPGCHHRAHWELLATYRGSVSEKHLRAYLDEYEFRYNRREWPVERRFEEALEAVVETPGRTLRQIMARPRPEGNPLSIFEVPLPGQRAARLRARRERRARLSS